MAEEWIAVMTEMIHLKTGIESWNHLDRSENHLDGQGILWTVSESNVPNKSWKIFKICQKLI